MRARWISTATAFAAFAALVAGVAQASGGPTLKAGDNPALGTIVVGANGHTVYRFLMETGSKIACTGACEKLWPPVLVAGSAKPVAGPGITASKLGETRRPDGTEQVTYYGHPLYRYSGDTSAGQANGQGIEKLWYAVAPSGTVVKLSAHPSSSANGGSSSGSSGASGGGYGY